MLSLFTSKKKILIGIKTGLFILIFTYLFIINPYDAFSLQPLEIVKRGDQVVNAPVDAYILSTMVVIDSEGYKNERKTEMFQKGKEKRLVRFLSPADQKGISFLALPDDVMYLYLPAFHKVRQIASHVKNQNFAGTDLTYDDLSAFELAEAHTAQLLGEENGSYLIKLSPEKTEGKEYRLLKVWYRKDNFYPVRVEYYDESGAMFKVIERRNLKQVKGYWIPMEMEVKNIKKEHTTKSIIGEVKFDIGLDEEVFTKRNLLRFR